MKNTHITTVAAGLLAISAPCSSAALVYAYEFNTLGDTEGFAGNNVTGLTADGDSLNGTASGNDPQLIISSPSGVTPTAGHTWTTLEFRVREVRGAPHGTSGTKGNEPTTADEITFSGVGLVVGNAPGTIGAGFSGTALDGSGFSVVTVDISSFGSNSFSAFRVDPIGGAWSNSNSQTDGNTFEVDYIRVFDTSPIPEPSSTALLGLGGLALILRRRK